VLLRLLYAAMVEFLVKIYVLVTPFAYWLRRIGH